MVSQKENPSPWLALIKYGSLFVLALIVFLSVFLYFRELGLLVTYRAIVWCALIFALAACGGSIFLLAREAVRGYKALGGTQRILFVLIFSVLLVLALVAASIGAQALPRAYADRADAFTLAGLPSYLGAAPGAITPSDVAQHLHVLVNAERARQGLQTLAYEPALEAIAQRHSNEMAANRYLEHVNKAGEDAIARGNRAGYRCKKDYGVVGNTHLESVGIGENLALTPLGNVVGCGSVYAAEDIARCTLEGWLNSTEHRKNILTQTYTQEGIGIARVEKDFYITQNFC